MPEWVDPLALLLISLFNLIILGMNIKLYTEILKHDAIQRRKQ